MMKIEYDGQREREYLSRAILDWHVRIWMEAYASLVDREG